MPIGIFRRCLAEALQLIAVKDCYEPRDRFLPIHAILSGTNLSGSPTAIPRGSRRCMRDGLVQRYSQGDYSLLLLQPRECVPFPSPRPLFPSWAVGYRVIDGAEADLRKEWTPPRYTPPSRCPFRKKGNPGVESKRVLWK